MIKKFKKIGLFLGVVFTLFLTGCASTKTISINQPEVKALAKTGVFTAGAATVDITPPPGFSMGGYSIMGSISQGFRTKLKARVVYLNDGKGGSLALVQTDLGSASSLVQHKVFELVAQKTGLDVSQIMIGATHTHSGPVNIFNNNFYNKHFGALAGLEESWFNILSSKIANAIIEAYQTRKPAKIATGKKDFYKISRNRSLAAYARNTTVGTVDLNDPESIFKHINPALNMIRVDVQNSNGAYKPLAVFSSFSVHATSINPDVLVYNADLFAYAQKDLEWYVEDKFNTKNMVHALVNATQGDIAPAVPFLGDNYFSHHPVDWKSSKMVGQKLGKAAIEVFDELGKRLTSDLKLDSAMREIDISKHNKINGVEICDIPMVGTALAGGAYEHRTPWLSVIPSLRGGWTARRHFFGKNGCQGAKVKLGGSRFQRVLEPTDTFPKDVVFQAHKINDMLILAVPFEVTTEAARRMMIKAQESFAKQDKFIKYPWVASVSNGYFGYTTTPEEYSYQEYEGGHTLYGKYMTPYITEQFGELASSIAKSKPIREVIPKWSYDLYTAEYMPKPVITKGQRKVILSPEFHAATQTYEEDYMLFKWLDVEPSKISYDKPLIRVEVFKNGQWQMASNKGERLDDEGYDLEVRYLADESSDYADNGQAVYQVQWYNPIKGGKYRIAIEPRGDFAKFYSPEFNY